jgi:hypothetical protein
LHKRSFHQAQLTSLFGPTKISSFDPPLTTGVALPAMITVSATSK